MMSREPVTSLPIMYKKTLTIKMTSVVNYINTNNTKSDPSVG